MPPSPPRVTPKLRPLFTAEPCSELVVKFGAMKTRRMKIPRMKIPRIEYSQNAT